MHLMCLQNGHPTNPYCQGIEGVLEAYYRTLQAVQLYGPTNFSPVINHVSRYTPYHCHSDGWTDGRTDGLMDQLIH